MKNKELNNWKAFGIACLVVVFLVLIQLWLKQDFNPDTDVCDIRCPKGFIECKDINYGWSSNSCLNWHPKALNISEIILM